MSKLLVVDDEFQIRQIIKKYAEFEGHTVEEAVDGMEAVEICRKNTYDLIIMDVMMPELDGFSACREIRKFTNTPVIMLSARGEDITEEMVIENISGLNKLLSFYLDNRPKVPAGIDMAGVNDLTTWLDKL